MNNQLFPKGALIQWPAGPGAPLGVIVESEFARVTVRFDDDPQVRLFNPKSGAIVRVALQGLVSRRSSGDIGTVVQAAPGELPRWQVAFGGRVFTIAESDLRPYVSLDPVSRVHEGRFGFHRAFSLAVTARRYELEQLSNELLTLGESRLEVKPHQVSVVHRVVSNYPHRFLLCDEVGLGKTIEAGMILKELRARGSAQRALIIVPPNLVRQWQFELKTKFNETFSVLNTDTVRFHERMTAASGNPFVDFDSVIVSSRWITAKRWSSLVRQVDWDLVIVDEAHHARARRSGNRVEATALYRLVRELVSPDAFSKRAALFLTATPMQLDSGELYSLVEILDPALFPTEQHFNLHRAAMPGLNRLVNDLGIHGFPLPAEPHAETAALVAKWLDTSVDDALGRLGSGAQGVKQVCEELSDRHLLSQVLIRNRKSVIGGFMPRRAHRWPVSLTAGEVAALRAVEDYVQSGYAAAERDKDMAIGFVMTIFQKLMASSLRALRHSLDLRRQRLELGSTGAAVAEQDSEALLEDVLDEVTELSDAVGRAGEAVAGEVRHLRQLVAMLDAIPNDSKSEVLVRQLSELRANDPAAKVLLFTQFRQTQEFLAERLNSIGWKVFSFHGQLKPEQKDAQVEGFRTSTEAAVLLSTEAGGEGRNFQFCNLLVNYDLPWNPMRIEQRIGRVDRIGQQHVVEVFNLYSEGTIEERVLNVLERRINIFEETVGGLDPILGDAERSISKALQSSGQLREQALRRFEESLEQQVQEARAAEVRLRDLIMDTRSFSGEIARLVGEHLTIVPPEDLNRFVRRLLLDVNTALVERPDGSYEITFREPFLSDYPAHTKDRPRKRLGAFRPDVCRESEVVEFFGFGNPLVDDLVGRVTSESYDGCTTAFEMVAEDGIRPTSGWLVVNEIGVNGVKRFGEFLPIFVHDDGEADVELGQALVRRAAVFPRDTNLAGSDARVHSLDVALDKVDAIVLNRLTRLETQAREDSERRVERERSKLALYFDYRDQAALDRLAAARTTLASIEESVDAERRRIAPVWRANVERDERLIVDLRAEREARMRQLELIAAGAGDSRLVALAWIRIVDPTPAEAED